LLLRLLLLRLGDRVAGLFLIWMLGGTDATGERRQHQLRGLQGLVILHRLAHFGSPRLELFETRVIGDLGLTPALSFGGKLADPSVDRRHAVGELGMVAHHFRRGVITLLNHGLEESRELVGIPSRAAIELETNLISLALVTAGEA